MPSAFLPTAYRKFVRSTQHIDSSHVCRDRAIFAENYREPLETATVANGQWVRTNPPEMVCCASVFESPQFAQWESTTSSSSLPLLSIKQLAQLGLMITFTGDRCQIIHGKGVEAVGTIENIQFLHGRASCAPRGKRRIPKLGQQKYASTITRGKQTINIYVLKFVDDNDTRRTNHYHLGAKICRRQLRELIWHA